MNDMEHTGPRLRRQHVVVVAAAVTLSGAILSLAGWATGTWWLLGGIPMTRAVNPNAAVALVALGGALLLVGTTRRLARAVVLLLGTVAAVAGGAALSAYLGGPGAALDTVLFVDSSVEGAEPRMAPQAAFGGLLLAVAVWVAALRPRWRKTIAVLTGLPAVASATALIGYLYGADVLYQPFSEQARAIAPFAAVGFHLLAVALFVRVLPRRTWQTLTAATPPAMLLRRVLPASLAALVLIGYGALSARRAGIFSSEVEAAAVVVLSGVVILVLLVHAGFQLNRYVLETERARRQADEAAALLQRQALELNDDVVQKLSTAWLAHQTGHVELVHDAVRQATVQAQRITAELLQARVVTDPLRPGSLVRTDAALGEARTSSPEPRSPRDAVE